jgi:CRP/FNR family transcriptional regulator
MDNAIIPAHKLNGVPCLSILEASDYDSLMKHARELELPRREVFSRFDGTDFIFLKKGAVKIYKTSRSGREMTVKLMRPGSHHCGLPISGGENHHVDAMAIENSTIITLPSAHHKRVLEGALDGKAMRLVGCLCKKIERMSGIIENFAFEDIENRICKVLLELSLKTPSKDGIVHISLTHHDIASMVGAAREVVSRKVAALKKEGIILESASHRPGCGQGCGFNVDGRKLAAKCFEKF